MRRRLRAAVLFSAVSLPLLAQPSTESPPPADGPIDRLGAVVKDGTLAVEVDMRAGRVPAIPKYALEVQGSPRSTIEADAKEGSVSRLHFAVENGRLIVRGSGLRPKVAIEALDFEDGRGVTNLKFRGLGIWRPIVAIFGGIARSAVRKMAFRTDVPSVLKGEILGGPRPPPTPATAPAAGPPPAPTPTPPPAAAPTPSGVPAPSFMDLVEEVRIRRLALTAFSDRPLEFKPFLEFRTARQPSSGDAMRVEITRGVYRPARDGRPAVISLAGRFDGEVEHGVMEYEKNRSTIARGRIQDALFEAKTEEDGRLVSSLAAKRISFELDSGRFVVPGGLRVDLDHGSSFDVADVKVASTGEFSGTAKLDLAGRTGEIARQGAKLSASNIRLRSSGLTVTNGRATGPVEVEFDYALQYPFVVKYPIEEIPEKRLLLDFDGPFATTLHLQDAGSDEGEVTGNYMFKAPWAPIEQAALAALEAKWRQDLAVKNVDFAIAPKMFRPCGESCFTLAIEFTAEKRAQKGLKKLFSQFCAPVGRASLFVNKPERSFELHDVKIETHCKGVVGFVINFLAPFLTKSYTNMKLFQMPPNLPLTIDTVRGGADWIEIGGTIDWSAGESQSRVPGPESRVESASEPGTRDAGPGADD
jgi:hypothetical protein